jgi:hypothetical protein
VVVGFHFFPLSGLADPHCSDYRSHSHNYLAAAKYLQAFLKRFKQYNINTYQMSVRAESSLKKLLLSGILILSSLLMACAPPEPVVNPPAPSNMPPPPGKPAGNAPGIRGTFGPPVTFATYSELEKYGFAFGPSDGQFGAIPSGGNNYTFYGSAGSNASCDGTPKTKGAFSFTGTLDHITGSNGCKRLFGPGDGPEGWAFDADYAGGGKVIYFEGSGKSGWLMPFHGEVWWKNAANPDQKCNNVNCFYSSLGLAVSIDNGKTFKVVGQIFQPSQPVSVFAGGNTNMSAGYGSMVVADANGKHLNNPPADPATAYYYLFYTDRLPGSAMLYMGVARAPYNEVVATALSGDPHRLARLFKKYDGASPDPWTQPATSDTPDQSGISGKFAPLWNDGPGGSEVIYDKSFDVYLAVYKARQEAIEVRASYDLINWSRPIGTAYSETDRSLYYPTFLGETGDPAIAGASPRIYFTSFPAGVFPNWGRAVFESVPFNLSKN